MSWKKNEKFYSMILLCISISWSSLISSPPCKLFFRRLLSTFNKSPSTFYLINIKLKTIIIKKKNIQIIKPENRKLNNFTFLLTPNSSDIRSAMPSLVSLVVIFIVALIVFSIIFWPISVRTRFTRLKFVSLRFFQKIRI